MGDPESVEQPPVGGFCEWCGHFAYRHDEDGCHTEDLVEQGIREKPCRCKDMKWNGLRWPRPWLPFPEGTKRS